MKSVFLIDAKEIIYAPFFKIGTCHQSVLDYTRDKDKAKWGGTRGWLVYNGQDEMLGCIYHALVVYDNQSLIDITQRPGLEPLFFVGDYDLPGPYKANYFMTLDGEITNSFDVDELSSELQTLLKDGQREANKNLATPFRKKN